MTWMPSMLVEQAFISNPKEEAMLLDPAFQRTMAKAIREGLEDYVAGER
jgi:N-acetylmuramoyl-L-alanine amidase